MSVSRKKNIDEAEIALKVAIQDMSEDRSPEVWARLTEAVSDYADAVFEVASVSQVLSLEVTEAVTDRAKLDAALGDPMTDKKMVVLQTIRSLVTAPKKGAEEGLKIANLMLEALKKKHGVSKNKSQSPSRKDLN